MTRLAAAAFALTAVRTASLAALVLALSSLAAPASAHHGRRYLILFKAGTSAQAKAATLRRLGCRLLREFPGLDMALVEHSEGAPQAAAAVEAFEEDFYVNWLRCGDGTLEGSAKCFSRPAATAEPSKDPYADVPWGVRRVHAPAAWSAQDRRTLGAGVSVAVIDTGVDCSHPDLSCDQSAGFNAIDPEASSVDDNGHGTHVAGTIAAKWNGAGVAGVAPLANVLPVKVLDAEGGGMVSDIVRGIDWAVDRGAKVINMSLGSEKGSPALQRAIRRAHERGVTVVAAAGNEGPGAGTVGYPAAYPETIAVAATDQADGIADFSSRGPEVDLAAPGAQIPSTMPGGGFAAMSGTSMAAPHVAGLAAIAVATGARGPAMVRAALLRAADRVCDHTACPHPHLQGAGVVDARRLVPRPALAELALR